jgi:hypothetical protein
MARPRPLLALGAALFLSIALIACGGDDKSEDETASANTSSASQGGQLKTINLAETTAKIGELKSFRFELNANIDIDLSSSAAMMEDEEALGQDFAALLLGFLRDIRVEGVVVAPDQFELKMSVAGQDFGFVKIADKAWMQTGGVWVPFDADDLSFSFDDFALDELTVGMLPQEVLEAAKVTKENLGGVDTTRYSFDKAAIESLAEDTDVGIDIDSAQLDVWLTEDGIPVKMLADFAGRDPNGESASIKFGQQLKDINGDIKIRAPM